MESAMETGHARVPEALASEKTKKGSKTRSRRRWRKGKAKGERAGVGSSPEGTLDILRGTGD